MAVLVGTFAADTISGGDGNDGLAGLDGDDLLMGAGGDDSLSGAAGNDTLLGGAGADTLSGGSSVDRLDGGDGDDYISDATGANGDLIGGAGADWLAVQNTSGTLIQQASSVTTMDGGVGDDTLILDNTYITSLYFAPGGPIGGVLSAGEGADYVAVFGAVTAAIDLGSGDDQLLIGSTKGLVKATLGDGVDGVTVDLTSASAPILDIADFRPGAGGDWLQIEDLRGILSGWNSSTPFEGGFVRLAQMGADTVLQLDLNGGGDAYQDYAILRGVQVNQLVAQNLPGLMVENGSVVGRVINITAITSEIVGSNLLYYTRSYTINGTDGSDSIGSTSAGSIHGNRGDDVVVGSSKNDYLYGDIGSDTISGGSGGDVIDGGDDAASNYLRGDDGNDQISGGAGFDDINGNMGDDVARGGNGDDWVVGGKDNDQLYGDFGGDIVWGNLGNDTLDGGDGADQVRGGQGDDILFGGAGSDFVSGDRGNDTITGGTGADIFHGSQDAGIDRVLDFKISEGDRVMLDPGTVYNLNQVGADTVIDMGGGHQMILVGVQLSSLGASWLFGV